MKQVLPRFYKPVKPILAFLSVITSFNDSFILSSSSNADYYSVRRVLKPLILFLLLSYGLQAQPFSSFGLKRMRNSKTITSSSATFMSYILSLGFKIFPWISIGRSFSLSEAPSKESTSSVAPKRHKRVTYLRKWAENSWSFRDIDERISHICICN